MSVPVAESLFRSTTAEYQFAATCKLLVADSVAFQCLASQSHAGNSVVCVAFRLTPVFIAA